VLSKIAMNIARYLLLRLKTLRGMTVVHVGAHFGQEATRYQNMMARRVIWVEASPTTFKVLTTNISKAQSQNRGFLAGLLSAEKTEHVCINALIGDNDARQQDFHIFENDGASNSIFRLDRSNKEYDAVRETGEVLSLPVKTLDRALAEAGVDPAEVDVLVLDTQGAELVCLKGATKLLSSARYIETEISTEKVYEGGVLLNELEEWLQERGFERKTIVRRSHMNAIFRKAG
jgi:FkbM family methyltransferase